ncbi:hypothetical protein T11_9793 [Trichinella zimbabwensis]|uniref:Uncharacterized protein n=1 Tax=Trichinella zimbabwensis TaxID=268475 RepID=A0A0V1GMT2_9BILA|nr:hypothetical protein T11_1944 [Trichinella zimbabwensis]KRY99658.1 hypothetical protein T11_9793 [Trichinella zimbabwensis]
MENFHAPNEENCKNFNDFAFICEMTVTSDKNYRIQADT